MLAIEVVIMSHTVIAAVGDNMDSLFVGVRAKCIK